MFRKIAVTFAGVLLFSAGSFAENVRVYKPFKIKVSSCSEAEKFITCQHGTLGVFVFPAKESFDNMKKDETVAVKVNGELETLKFYGKANGYASFAKVKKN